MRRFINYNNLRRLILTIDENKKVISLVFAATLAVVGTEKVTNGGVTDIVANHLVFTSSANASTK